MTAGVPGGDRVVVVGAGVAGMACAIELAAAGLEVVVLERDNACGGKMRPVRAAGAEFDGGPTVLTMRGVFEELFDRAGRSLDDRLRLTGGRVLARHGWQDGSLLDLFADRAQSAAAIEAFAGAREAEGYMRFCRDAGAIFRALDETYIRAARPNPAQLAARIAARNPAALLSLRPFSTLWSTLGSYFRDPRLRQLYGRYATYVGSSPFLAPATLMLIAHVEQEGVWLVEGGMRALARALEQAGRDLGVVYRRNADVEAIRRTPGGLEVWSQETGAVQARAVVWCGDHAAIASGSLGEGLVAGRAVSAPQRSLSAMVWTATGRTACRTPAHHTVCFSRDYRAEFDQILGKRQLPGDPTVYVCAQDRDGEGGRRDGGPERLYLLVNAPADGDRTGITRKEAGQCLRNAMTTLTNCGFRLELEDDARLASPQDWHVRFPGTGGALYGRASHGWTASFRRPGARTRTPGLYLAGGSVHPGPGVPMAAISGRLAAQALLSDLTSAGRLRRVVIAGGMPTG